MTGKGSAYLARHLEGKPLTPKQAILAKCAECTANYVDGRVSCGLEGCPLFPYHPYNACRKKSRVGKVDVRGKKEFSLKSSVEDILPGDE